MNKLFVILSGVCLVFVFAFSACNSNKQLKQEQTQAQPQEQTEKPAIYNPLANADEDIAKAVAQAKAENKNVLLQIGGNWCPWCVKMHKVLHSETKLDSMIKANYVYILVNYSKEHKNLPVMKELDFPQRFGFPVLVILNQDGKRVHTQDTGFLEKDKGESSYDNDKIYTFLKSWTVKSLDPASYPVN